MRVRVTIANVNNEILVEQVIDEPYETTQLVAERVASIVRSVFRVVDERKIEGQE